MSSIKIMIVEDEILIADTIERYLLKKGYEVVGKAISFEKASVVLLEQSPDLALLDIRLSGEKTGIDFAHFMQSQPEPKPFIYLTSQLDSRSIDLAKETFPAGYLSKPIQRDSLFATIEIALHNFMRQEKSKTKIQLFEAGVAYNVSIDDILYLKVDHIYVKIFLNDGREIVHRSALKEIVDKLPTDQFIQTHRSFVVNINQVSHADPENIYVSNQAIPISRSRRKNVQLIFAS